MQLTIRAMIEVKTENISAFRQLSKHALSSTVVETGTPLYVKTELVAVVSSDYAISAIKEIDMVDEVAEILKDAQDNFCKFVMIRYELK